MLVYNRLVNSVVRLGKDGITKVENEDATHCSNVAPQ
jgi:hypothetical protein